MGRPCSPAADECATPADDLEAYVVAQTDVMRYARQLRDALAAAWLPTVATAPYLELGGALDRLDAVADNIRAHQ